jgi:hypothetical protein
LKLYDEQLRHKDMRLQLQIQVPEHCMMIPSHLEN